MPPLYFNPWNDLALAANDPHYTPPASARQMAHDLQELPRLWGATPFTSAAAPFLVWGWSPLLVRLLREAGVAANRLPTTEQMEAYRAWSSRQTAVRLLERLRASCPEAFGSDGSMVGESAWCRTEEEVLAAIGAYGGTAMLKAPWSGSGRGVRKVEPHTQEARPQSLSWIRCTLARQGGIEVEPFYERVQDLAFEFWAEAGRVRYEGLSVFATTPGGVYAGNLVATEDEKLRRLARYVAPDLLHWLRQRLTDLLSAADIPTWYTGPLGVDMMITHRSSLIPHRSSLILHPLIELNLRMTMGWVALQLVPQLREAHVGNFHLELQNGRYQAFFTQKQA